MPITRKSSGNGFTKYIERQVQLRLDACIELLDYVGLECVKEARTARRYTDRTGNLRSSTGYYVLYEGRVVKKGGFEAVSPQAAQGPSEGAKFIARVASEHPSGIVLIVVAGMSYAAYVEANGYNVLDSAEKMAGKLVPQLLKDLGLR
jgi:hypothetical protein